MDARAYLGERAQRVDRLLQAILPAENDPPEALHRAMRHAVFLGGKRIRPAFAFAGAEAVGAEPDTALPMAGAVELVHAYSLVHDDLPCMDDAAERRGAPSVHRAFGEAVAVLAGDALLAEAFACLARGAEKHPPDRVVRLVAELADAAGARHLVGGQVDDLAFDAGCADAARVEDVHRRKSAALIRVSVVGGALLAGAGEPALAHLARFGESAGVAFQIADDVLDEDDDEGCSLVRAVGVERARARARELLDRALDALEPFGPAAEPLRALARFAVRRDR